MMFSIRSFVLYLGMAVCLHMDYLCYALVAVCGVYASSTMNFDDYAHWDTRCV